jgi:hypothetical protein
MADKCEAYRALIEEAAGGRGETGRALGPHLEACAECREFRRGREALLGLLGGLERVSAPDDFEFRLRARMARQRGAGGSWLRRLRFAPGLASAAVALCLLAAAALYFRSPQRADNAVAGHREAPAAPVSTSGTDAGGASRKEDAVLNREREAAVEIAVGRQDKPQRHLPAVNAESGGRKSAPRTRRAQREDTFGVRVAAVIDGGKGRPAAADTATQAVALRTSPDTLRVVLRDARGGSYVVPVRSVSFGAQGPVGRDARAVRASFTDKEGVW